jgi:hypothetical protein
MSSPSDHRLPVGVRVVRRHPRPLSDERRWFLTAIRGQLAGAKILAYLAMAVATSSGVWWIIGTTGSPIIGVGFIALGTMLGASIWAFAGLMRMIGGAPVTGQSPAARLGVPAAPGEPPPPNPSRQTP